ncbi:hypothetical protein BH11PSE2_BH11PSE2_21580 [soil metagenome]
MTEARWTAISQMIQRQQVASKANKEAARESLMRSGLYNPDGSLKAAYGGAKPAAR